VRNEMRKKNVYHEHCTRIVDLWIPIVSLAEIIAMRAVHRVLSWSAARRVSRHVLDAEVLACYRKQLTLTRLDYFGRIRMNAMSFACCGVYHFTVRIPNSRVPAPRRLLALRDRVDSFSSLHQIPSVSFSTG
jgi:hypothetical protein